MVDITPVVNAVIALCAAIISAFVIPWLREKAGRERLERLYRLTEIAVNAAEQLYGSAAGMEKRQYVLDFLNARGYKLTVEELSGALEAAVFQMNKAANA